MWSVWGALLLGASSLSRAAALPPVQVERGGHYLEAGQRPFFWMGDTAWELIHGTTREECSYYLATRARQHFNVIQTVVLAELEGIRKPSALGLSPFRDEDPAKPNEAYFDRVVEVVDEAASLGLYVALMPAWGDKVDKAWGVGPVLFTNDNLPVAREYARYLARKLRGRTNVIWVLGGDRQPVSKGGDFRPIWRAMAEGIADVAGKNVFITYHPTAEPQGTSSTLHNEPWLAMNAIQSGHGAGRDEPTWDYIARDFALVPNKPALDMEPNYEDHPVSPWPRWDPGKGYYRDHDVRKQVYRSVFAGGAGVTYGHHAIWPFVGERNAVVNHADRDWRDALTRPAGTQMQFLRHLMESRPQIGRVPDQRLIKVNADSRACHARATRGEGYALVYLPCYSQTLQIDASFIGARQLRAWWYDPRNGVAQLGEDFAGNVTRSFTSPSVGPDWILVLDDTARNFAPPGLQK